MILGGLERAFAHIAAWCARQRWVVFAITVVFAGVGLYFAMQARTDTGMSTFFDANDPTFEYYQSYQREFNPDEIIYLLYRAPGTEYGPFDLKAMRTIAKLTETLEREMPFVRKVTSLANVEFVKATDDLIVIHDLVFDEPYTQADLVKLREIALSKPLYLNNLIDPTGEYGAVVVDMTRNSTEELEELKLDPDAGDGAENLYPYASSYKLSEILAREEFSTLEVWRSGDVPFLSDYNDLIRIETPLITLMTFALIALLSLLLFPTRLAGLLGPLAVVLLAIIATVGFMGFMQYHLGLLFMMVPTLICAIGVSQCVHIMLAHRRAAAGAAGDPVEAAIREVGVACFLAALTTAIGFLGMSTSALRSISELGVYSAFGVMLSFVFAVTLMVSFAALRKRKPTVMAKARITNFDGLLRWVVAANRDATKLVLGISAIALVTATYGILKLKVDYNFIDELKPHVEIRKHIEKAESVMGGWVSAVYVFDTREPEGIVNAELLHFIEDFAGYAESHAQVKKTQHVVEIIKDLNQAFHADDPAWYRLPDDRETLAQLLFLYQMSGGEEINDFINFDSSQTTVQLRIKLDDASKINRVITALDEYIDEQSPAGFEVRKSGIGVLWIKITGYIASSQLQGYAIVFSLIFVFMWVAFGSFKVAALAMIANLTPIALILGFMGFIEMKLDYFRLLLATIAIGIAVDDTIHLVMAYRSEFRRQGNYGTALASAMSSVGPALITTTLILVGAFLSYLISELAVLSSFGILLAGAVFFALIADLFLLPALILRFKPFGPEFKPATA